MLAANSPDLSLQNLLRGRTAKIMFQKRIFIIDDEPDMVKIGSDLLTDEGFFVDSALHPDAGLKGLRENPPDLILLDVRLPGRDGFEILREIKNDVRLRGVPVIMVSVKGDESDIVVGLELGADDYIVKPFRRKELLARVKTVLRRHSPNPPEQKIIAGPIEVDLGRFAAKVKGKDIDFTPKEFQLLAFLLQHEGRVLTRQTISESVWGVQFTGSTRTIDVHVDQIRKKLGRYGKLIRGLKGVGYRFELES